MAMQRLACVILRTEEDPQCECLARLAISNKIPKCPLTQFTNPSSDHLTLKIKALLRSRGM